MQTGKTVWRSKNKAWALISFMDDRNHPRYMLSFWPKRGRIFTTLVAKDQNGVLCFSYNRHLIPNYVRVAIRPLLP